MMRSTVRWFILSLAGLFALPACTGPDVRDGQTNRTCGRHDSCRDGEACIMGYCHRSGLDEAMDVSSIQASQWFTYQDGSCYYDDHCGPWVCHNGQCATPESAGRTMLTRGEYAYWDSSCTENTDCGTWVCVNQWCTDPAFSSNPMGTFVSTQPDYSQYGLIDNGVGNGQSCLGDDECGAGADCMYPGYCHPGRGGETMTWVDIPGTGWFNYTDGSCLYDTDCGPFVCVSGWCFAPEETDRPLQTRNQFYYYDTSCNYDYECGSWMCISGWCNDPTYAYNYSPDPNGQGQASGGGGYDDYYYDDYYYDDYYYDDYYEDDYYGYGGCSTHMDCGTGYACYNGYCEWGMLDTLMDTSYMDASLYFANADGKCAYDNECGPWMCSPFGECQPPNVVGRQMQTVGDYYYYDTSCNSDSECGDWTCLDGWCTQPGYGGP